MEMINEMTMEVTLEMIPEMIPEIIPLLTSDQVEIGDQDGCPLTIIHPTDEQVNPSTGHKKNCRHLVHSGTTNFFSNRIFLNMHTHVIEK